MVTRTGHKFSSFSALQELINIKVVQENAALRDQDCTCLHRQEISAWYTDVCSE